MGLRPNQGLKPRTETENMEFESTEWEMGAWKLDIFNGLSYLF